MRDDNLRQPQGARRVGLLIREYDDIGQLCLGDIEIAVGLDRDAGERNAFDRERDGRRAVRRFPLALRRQP
jgi:hypothetical protein